MSDGVKKTDGTADLEAAFVLKGYADRLMFWLNVPGPDATANAKPIIARMYELMKG